MGGGVVSTLGFGLKIINMFFWIEDMGSSVLSLFCWRCKSRFNMIGFIMMLLEMARCVDAPY